MFAVWSRGLIKQKEDRDVKELLRRVSKFDFEISAVIVDKSKMQKTSPRNFYNRVIADLLMRAPINNVSVRIDGHGGTSYIKAATAHFERVLM